VGDLCGESCDNLGLLLGDWSPVMGEDRFRFIWVVPGVVQEEKEKRKEGGSPTALHPVKADSPCPSSCGGISLRVG